MQAVTPNVTSSVRILVVEDQAIMRDVLGEWIESDSRWKLAGSCSTLAEARIILQRGGVDLVVLDVELPDGSGLDLLEGFALEDPPAIVLITAHEQPWLLRDAARTSVLGIVMKGAPLSDLRRAIEKAAHREASYCRRTSELMRNWAMRVSPHERITPRETEVLRHVVEGRTSREIAAILGIREKTVQNHRANLMEKLDIHDVPALVRYAIAHGLTSA
jgi:DNA-binding NarL/FixJ family response regulator